MNDSKPSPSASTSPSSAGSSASRSVDAPPTLPGHSEAHALNIGKWALWGALAAFVVWGALAPLDEGIPAQGMVTLDTKRKAVQHLQGGIVREVKVGEGDVVKEGQVLMVLEQALATANFESIRQHYLALRSSESRLMAEQSGAGRVQFHPDITHMLNDALVRQQVDTQEQLFRSRKSALSANLAALQENQAGLQEQRKGTLLVLAQRQKQWALYLEELKGIKELVDEGYAPRSRQYELERNVADLGSVLADAQATLQRIARSIEEVSQRMQATQQEYKKDVDTQLVDIRREVQADAEKLKAVTQDLERTELRSPAAGQVVGLAVQTVGAVVTPGQKLMDIVPERAPLLIEARVQPQLIDRLKNGQAADIRFSAFSHTPQLTVAGVVKSVSSDLLTDPDLKQSFYLARVEITPQGLQTLGIKVIQPGMMAEVLIKTGERSFFTYLAYPIVRRFAQSMKEE